MSDPLPAAANEERRFQGLAASGGIARGLVYVLHHDDEEVPKRSIKASEVENEIERLENALLATREQISALQQRVEESIGAENASIFDAHLLVTEDSTLNDEVLKRVRRERLNIEFIYSEVADRFVQTFAQMNDPYLRERAADIHDVARRVIHNLLGKELKSGARFSEPHILVAHDLTPSDIAEMPRDLVLGLITEAGGQVAHAAIIARSLRLPAVIGLAGATSHLATGDSVLLDGYDGLVVINPTEQTLWEYGQIESRHHEIEERLDELRDTQAITQDGRKIILSANIELPEDVPMVKASGAEGVGLYRTEFIFLNRNQLPSESDQFDAYRRVAEEVLPHSVIIRTLDVGGDKLTTALNVPGELNPFLGWRAIRLCLERVDVFKAQLRAILRASAHGNVRIMFPMISSVVELRKAKAILAECRDELRNEGIPFSDHIEIGAMVEIPSAALTADILAPEVDFFSIGTNDLVQYTIAVDRLNERISYLYQPAHPAILRLIEMTVKAAHAAGIWVGVCGEMAGDIQMIPLLLGLGIDELSTGAANVPRVKRVVQSLTLSECQALAERVKAHSDPLETLTMCRELAAQHYPELL